MNKSYRLSPEPPLLLFPSLAVKIGDREAILLQQLHYWLGMGKIGKMGDDGRKYVRNSITEWQRDNFPFWSARSVQRYLESLQSQGIIISTSLLNDDPIDRTLWYSIDYDKLESLFDDDLEDGGQYAKMAECNMPKWQNAPSNLAYSYRRTETTTTENTFSENSPPSKPIKTPKPTKAKKDHSKRSEPILDPSTRDAWLPLMAQILYGHEDLSLLLPFDVTEMEKTIKVIAAAGYSPDDLKAWYLTRWRSIWPGNQGQPPTLAQIRKGIGSTRSTTTAKESPTNEQPQRPAEAKRYNLSEIISPEILALMPSLQTGGDA